MSACVNQGYDVAFCRLLSRHLASTQTPDDATRVPFSTLHVDDLTIGDQ